MVDEIDVGIDTGIVLDDDSGLLLVRLRLLGRIVVVDGEELDGEDVEDDDMVVKIFQIDIFIYTLVSLLFYLVSIFFTALCISFPSK